MTALTATERIHYSPHIGTELPDVQLTELDDEGVADLQRLAAERCVLVFREQHMTIDDQIAFGARLGPLHIHPVYADKTRPEALRIHADANSRHAVGEAWHTDVSCDDQPPALSMLRIEITPPCGRDTAYASMYAAYESLSEPIRHFLLTLRAVHTGDLPFRHTHGSRSGQPFPSATHPVVRTHPLTGRRALYVNSGFTDKIEGLTRAESRALLGMLFAHIADGVNFQCRVRWEPNTVTMWDNRCAQHHASFDYFPETRSGWRVTTVGEKPVLVD